MANEPLKINLYEWTPKGRGGQGVTFEHVSNPDILLKLYDPIFNLEYLSNEIDLIDKIRAIGIQTPSSGELVTDGTRYGAIFQRIKNKKSFCRVVSEHPDQVEEIAKKMAAIVKKLHTMPVEKPEQFLDYRERLRKGVMENNGLSPKYKKKAESLFKHLPPAKCYCHGDLQFGNIITDGNDYWFIDMGLFCVGTPEYEFASFFNTCFIMDETLLKKTFHVNRKLAIKFWDCFIREYYGRKLSRSECIDMFEIPYILRLYWYCGSSCISPAKAILKTGKLSLLKYM